MPTSQNKEPWEDFVARLDAGEKKFEKPDGNEDTLNSEIQDKIFYEVVERWETGKFLRQECLKKSAVELLTEKLAYESAYGLIKHLFETGNIYSTVEAYGLAYLLEDLRTALGGDQSELSSQYSETIKLLDDAMTSGILPKRYQLEAVLNFLYDRLEVLSQSVVEKAFADIGENFEDIPIDNRHRLSILEMYSQTFQDSIMIKNGGLEILNQFASEKDPDGGILHFTEGEKNEFARAALLHDVGKSGPESADISVREVVSKLFSVKNISQPTHMVNISWALKTYFPKDWKKMLGELEKSGVDPEWPMRKLYDKHSLWSYEILLKHPEGLLTDKLVASHHAERESNLFGDLEWDKSFDISEIKDTAEIRAIVLARLLMIIDKYQAGHGRKEQGTGRFLSHQEILAAVSRSLEAKFKNDAICNLILQKLRVSDPAYLFKAQPVQKKIVAGFSN